MHSFTKLIVVAMLGAVVVVTLLARASDAGDNGAEGALSGAGQTVGEKLDTAADKTKSTYDKAKQGVSGTLDTAREKAKSAMDSAGNAIGDAKNAAADAVIRTGEKAKGDGE